MVKTYRTEDPIPSSDTVSLLAIVGAFVIYVLVFLLFWIA